MKTETKSEVVGFGASSISAIAAAYLAQKSGLDIQSAGVVIGLAAAIGRKLVKWVGRLKPHA